MRTPPLSQLSTTPRTTATRRARHSSAGSSAGPVATRPVELDLVIPAFNEEHRIGPTLHAIDATLRTADIAARILVVDNGSVDDTAQVVDTARGHGIATELISCATRGKGAAVRTGISCATAPYVGYIDADQSTPAEALITGVAILRSGWDAVIGSRRALGARYVVKQPPLRRIGSRVFNAAATPMVGRVADTQCGMKLFRTAAVRTLFSEVSLEGFAFDVEVLARARAADLAIMELPITWTDDSASTLRPLRDGTTAFRELVRLHKTLRKSA